MHRVALFKLVAPLVGMSLMLAALGGLAAWNVQRQQSSASEAIAREVHGLVAIHNLYIAIREVRYQLNQYLRLGNEKHLDEISALDESAKRMLAESRRLSDNPVHRAGLRKVDEGYQLFVADLAEARSLPSLERRLLLEGWADSKINELILDPAQECVILNEQVVTHTNEENRLTARRFTQGFLVLGVAGSAAGVFMGLTIARSLQRWLQDVHVSVAGAAGKLERVEGPFPAPPTGGLVELSMGAKHLERRVTQVVEELQQREHEVLRNEQLAAVGQLAAGLAHELRNPLMPMKMLVQRALEHPGEGGLKGRQLQVVEDEITRMETSIQAFLDFAKPQLVEKQRFDLRRVVEGVAGLAEGRARTQDVTIECRLLDEPFEFEFDPVQIKQVVLNLLLNALDEIGPRGHVTIELSRGPSFAGPEPSKLGALIVVFDDGPGMPPELVAKIFEPFVTDKELGTGLGLTICRRIVEAHGGCIEAANRPQGGAEFRVWLPA